MAACGGRTPPREQFSGIPITPGRDLVTQSLGKPVPVLAAGGRWPAFADLAALYAQRWHGCAYPAHTSEKESVHGRTPPWLAASARPVAAVSNTTDADTSSHSARPLTSLRGR